MYEHFKIYKRIDVDVFQFSIWYCIYIYKKQNKIVQHALLYVISAIKNMLFKNQRTEKYKPLF